MGHSVLKRVFSTVSNALCPSLELRIACVLLSFPKYFEDSLQDMQRPTTTLRVIKYNTRSIDDIVVINSMSESFPPRHDRTLRLETYIFNSYLCPSEVRVNLFQLPSR